MISCLYTAAVSIFKLCEAYINTFDDIKVLQNFQINVSKKKISCNPHLIYLLALQGFKSADARRSSV